MELRQLEYFVAVTEEANFTRAAARLHVAQPGVSAQIRRLEAELGQTLLDRSARAVRLTEVGAEVLPYAQAALNAVANCRLVVDELTGLIRGHVSVGMITSLPFDLPSLLAGFHDDHPAVELTLSEATSGNLLDSLRAGQLDLAWIGSVVSPSAGIETQIVEEQPLVAAVAHPDSWAAKASVALRELEGRPLISLPLGTGLRTRFDEACVLGGVRARIAFEASNLEILGQLAARGLGVGILPQSYTDAHPQLLHALTITHPPIRVEVQLAWRAEGPISPAARALIGHARSSLANLSTTRKVSRRV